MPGFLLYRGCKEAAGDRGQASHAAGFPHNRRTHGSELFVHELPGSGVVFGRCCNARATIDVRVPSCCSQPCDAQLQLWWVQMRVEHA